MSNQTSKREAVPHITMDPKVHLRGQSYDRFKLLGPLTNRRIEYYMLAGFYGSKKMEAARKRKAARELKKLAALTPAEIMKQYGIDL